MRRQCAFAGPETAQRWVESMPQATWVAPGESLSAAPMPVQEVALQRAGISTVTDDVQGITRSRTAAQSETAQPKQTSVQFCHWHLSGVFCLLAESFMYP